MKALLDWQGRPLIIHQIVALREAGADEVIVVLGHRADELQARVGANRDVYNLGGGAVRNQRGLRSGENYLNQNGPLGAWTLRQSRSGDLNVERRPAAFSQDHQANVGRPSQRGWESHHHPNLSEARADTSIAVSRGLYHELIAIDEQTQGMKAVTERHRDATRRVELGAPELLWDVNTPEQYQAALRESGAA